jgi:XTP/dITP diphosphohydrolase
MDVYLVTKNPGKLKAAKSVFDVCNIHLLPVEKDYPEIQAATSLEIARFTALQAAKDLGAPAIREDHSFFIHALGVPGPYTSYMEKRIEPEKLLKIINCLKDDTGHFEVATVYAESNGETFEYTFQVPITLGKEVKGKNPHGWNGLIRLYDEERAITEYPEEERLSIWNEGYRAVAKYINSKNS